LRFFVNRYTSEIGINRDIDNLFNAVLEKSGAALAQRVSAVFPRALPGRE
jgi:hypothetical protein